MRSPNGWRMVKRSVWGKTVLELTRDDGQVWSTAQELESGMYQIRWEWADEEPPLRVASEWAAKSAMIGHLRRALGLNMD